MLQSIKIVKSSKQRSSKTHDEVDAVIVQGDKETFQTIGASYGFVKHKRYGTGKGYIRLKSSDPSPQKSFCVKTLTI